MLTIAGFEIPFWVENEGENSDYLGRLITKRSDSSECFDLAKSWYVRCTRSHGPRCSLQADVILPSRLVHISRDDPNELKLCITKGMHGEYVTLSYCWGEGTFFKTVANNIDGLLRGFHASELPKTLHEAVQISHKMGFEWIWIDSLCIQQDDIDDWSRESSLMGKVYGNSAFTICADSTSSTDDGIFKQRAVVQSHTFGPQSSYRFQTVGQPWGDITEQALYRRGWAFQERLLSTRNLHFFESQMSWECNTTMHMEDFRNRQTYPAKHFAKHMFTKYYHQSRIETSGKPSEMDIYGRIGAWNAILQEMSVRELTFRSDKLPAISGLASAIQIEEMGKYFAGVWSYNPFLSMAWFPRFPQIPTDIYLAPSWSSAWTRWQLVWHDDTWDEDLDPDSEQIADWRAWNTACGPRLVEHNMVHKGLDPKGEVLEGSSLTMTGYCRQIYVVEIPDTDADDNFEEVASRTGRENYLGSKVFMDYKTDNWNSMLSFEHDFADQDNEVQKDNVKEYLCVQIARERKKKDYHPKTLGLLLEPVANEGEITFKRAGLVALDELDSGQWAQKTLRLV